MLTNSSITHKGLKPLPHGILDAIQDGKKMLQIFGAILGFFIAAAITPWRAVPATGALGITIGVVVISAFHKLMSDRKIKRREKNLDSALLALLEELSLLLSSGNSLQTGLLLANNSQNKDIVALQGLLKSGLDLENAVTFWLDEFHSSSKRKVADLLLAKTTITETLALLDNHLDLLRSEQKYTMIAEMERRDQLVWIPVTIAVLLPGMIFLAIPLQATLKTLIG